ncbi:hypothetical protein [Nocardioides nitrophenolicus]|uniref:hypothetical protein n=1 Tax=Nocardioides nitrophenolicus TaxID=60489 RepID=UPI001958B703|nr:hypothetical protein [Nocardioides nitrophenolicus]MBM7516209.1 hypothetical protein [Nocardioides nitrophenolicus]
MTGHYDASAPPPDESGPSLLDLASADVDRRLEAVLDVVDDLAAEGEERRLAEGIDPATAALYEAIAGAEDAPLELRSLHRRVHEGRLTWADVWARPSDHDGGTRLLFAAMTAQGRGLAAEVARLAGNDGDDEPGRAR